MNTIYCNNCGVEGHLYRDCKLPVLSYGVIIFNNEKKILMLQRKDSIAYIEFIRGKYELNNLDYIIKLLNSCTIKERDKLKSNTFDILWNTLWFIDDHTVNQTNRMKKEYLKSKNSFEELSLNNTLNELINKCSKSYITPEWEFPKGRRSHKESNIKCAIREFEEETDLHSNEYMLVDNVAPISEAYIGSNGVRYKHIYYYAIYKGDRDLSINKDKYEQFSEIGDIRWFTPEECYKRIRPENPTKNDIIRTVYDFMMNWEKECYLDF